MKQTEQETETEEKKWKIVGRRWNYKRKVKKHFVYCLMRVSRLCTFLFFFFYPVFFSSCLIFVGSFVRYSQFFFFSPFLYVTIPWNEEMTFPFQRLSYYSRTSAFVGIEYIYIQTCTRLTFAVWFIQNVMISYEHHENLFVKYNFGWKAWVNKNLTFAQTCRYWQLNGSVYASIFVWLTSTFNHPHQKNTHIHIEERSLFFWWYVQIVVFFSMCNNSNRFQIDSKWTHFHTSFSMKVWSFSIYHFLLLFFFLSFLLCDRYNIEVQTNNRMKYKTLRTPQPKITIMFMN